MRRVLGVTSDGYLRISGYERYAPNVVADWLEEEMIALYHELGCGKLALWATVDAVVAHSTDSAGYRLPDGGRVPTGALRECGSCGKPLLAYPQAFRTKKIREISDGSEERH